MFEYPKEVITAAENSQKKWGIFASVSLAQWKIESAGGKSMSGKNNPFGIKATKAQIAAGKATCCWTHETLKGQYVKVQQYFADYDNVEDAFDAHADLLATSGYYVKSRHDKSPDQFAIDLTGIYATGIPGHPYGQVLIDEMHADDLYQYDNPITAPIKTEKPPIVVEKHIEAAAAAAGAATVVPAIVTAATHPIVNSVHVILPLFAAIAIVAAALIGFVVYITKKNS
jgi:hypothetical protein